MFRLSDAAAPIGARALGIDSEVRRVTTDSRDVRAGDMFVAIRGERFDGHDYVDQALAHGAVAALISERTAVKTANASLLIVDDVRIGFGRLAGWWRSKFSIPLVAITGSNGKTTVKEMLAAILRQHAGDDAVLATRGNLNNDIGMPKMLLELAQHHRYAVIEMGMNHLGEIAWLSRIAKPDVAVINNAGTAHIGEVGSVEAIARAKGEIFTGLIDGGVAVINADDAFAEYWRSLAGKRRRLEFGLNRRADVTASYELGIGGSLMTLRTPQQESAVSLRVPGLHNVKNALAAASAGYALGVTIDSIATGLQAYTGVAGRLQMISLGDGNVLIDDTYNANPESSRAAISVLATARGKKILVLGDMGELGEGASEMHADIGSFARRAGIDHVLTIGSLAGHATRVFGDGAAHFENVDHLVEKLREDLDGSTTTLIKGSRFMRMERVVQALRGDVPTPAGGTH